MDICTLRPVANFHPSSHAVCLLASVRPSHVFIFSPAVAHNLWQCPAPFHHAATKMWHTPHHFMSVYLSFSFFSLPISMCLILLFLLMSLSYPSHFFTYFPSDAFFSTLTYIFFYFQVLFYCCLAPLSCAFHLRVMDFNPYQPTYKGMKSREGWFALSFLTFMKL